MPDFCTCGAQLPPDALFCHKCGKPQREQPPFEDEEPIAAPPPPPPPPVLAEPPPISLRNRHAVLVALFGSVVAWVLSAILGPLSLLGLATGGFLAVFLYTRLTGHRVVVRNGVRLGWMTGLFFFIGALLMLSIGLSTQPEVVEELRKAVLERLPQDQRQQGQELLQGPTLMVLLVLSTFVSSTLLAIAGGALGAKLLGGGGRAPHHPHA